MKNQKSFSFLYSVLVMSIWLCVSCSHTKNKADTLEGLSAEAASSDEVKADAPKTDSTESVAKADEEVPAAATEQVALNDVTGDRQPALENSDLVATNSAASVEQQAPAAEASAATSAPETVASSADVKLDGSAAGFLSSGPTTEGSNSLMNTQSNPEGSKASDILSNNVSPMMPEVVAPVTDKPAEKPAKKVHHHNVMKTSPTAKIEIKPAQAKAAPMPVQMPIQVSQQQAPASPAPSVAGSQMIKPDAAMIAKAMGEEQSPPAIPTLKVKPREVPKAKKLASVEIGSFIEKHLLFLAVCIVAFFATAFVMMKSKGNKDFPL